MLPETLQPLLHMCAHMHTHAYAYTHTHCPVQLFQDSVSLCSSPSCHDTGFVDQTDLPLPPEPGKLCVTLTQLKSSESREPQLRQCLHKIWQQADLLRPAYLSLTCPVPSDHSSWNASNSFLSQDHLHLFFFVCFFKFILISAEMSFLKNCLLPLPILRPVLFNYLIPPFWHWSL